MRYRRFLIEKYKAVKDAVIRVEDRPIPIIGLNESGKSSILEGILRFDTRNDAMADARALTFLNRYYSSEDNFSVLAEIDFSQDESDLILSKFSEEEKPLVVDLLSSPLQVRRMFRLSTPNLYPYSIKEDEGDLVQRLMQVVFDYLPRILYFDSFIDNGIPDFIKFPDAILTTTALSLGESEEILRNMFIDAGKSPESFLNNNDETSRESQLLEISQNATRKIIADWKKMHIDVADVGADSFQNIEINIKQDAVDRFTFHFKIIESFRDANGNIQTPVLKLSERSQGFKWFFNFSARKNFASMEDGKFLYLLDEPGSYLHASAQIVLISAIAELAKKYSVIFTTHSDLLLNPNIININSIKIAEKKYRVINLTSYAEAKGKKLLGTISPLMKALRSNVDLENTTGKNVIVLEGITDFYFWKMITKNIIFLPGHGAGENEYLISIAIGTSKKYVALFDGDDAGKQAIIKYTNFFGEDESKNWLYYKNKAGKEVELEDLISKKDQERLLSITEASDLKKAITLLFFSDKISEYWENINQETKGNIQSAVAEISKVINIPKADIKFNVVV